MKCVVCKIGNTRPGHTSVTIERGGTTLVFKAVPAEVCDNCGEAYVSEEVSKQILASAEHAALSGVQVGVQEFAGAAT
ncbi:MAG: type II toxin-antitoxin system MqsA family antitoxin [Terriglobia bacterium]|jgi:YgiT-type zinc finger domain-containing protein